MSNIILTIKQLEDIFQSLTVTLTGLNKDSGVRVSWPTEGSPGWKITDNVAFIKVVSVTDNYSNIVETNYQQDELELGVNVELVYTRVHLIQWVLYRPNSYELAEKIKSGLFLYDTKQALNLSNLFLVTDIEQPVRIPEQANGRWWERCDYQARFNEKVVKASTVPYITGTNIQFRTSK